MTTDNADAARVAARRIKPDNANPTGSAGSRTDLGPRPIGSRLAGWHALPVAVATLVLFGISAAFVPSSVSNLSFVTVAVPSAVAATAAIGQTLVIQQKGIDLSTAGVITLSGVLMSVLTVKMGLSPWLSVGVVIVSALVIGFANAVLVVRFSITPIIATLASNALVYGLVWSISRGSQLVVPAGLIEFSSIRLQDIPLMVWLVVLVVILSALFMRKSMAGHRFVAVGANQRSARAAGIASNGFIIGAYVMSALFSGLAGIVLVGYIGSASLSSGNPYQLSVIAAVVVGGTSLAGGRGTIIGSAIACLFLTQITQLLLTIGAPNSIQLLVQAVAIVIAATIHFVLVIPKLWKRRADQRTADRLTTGGVTG